MIPLVMECASDFWMILFLSVILLSAVMTTEVNVAVWNIDMYCQRYLLNEDQQLCALSCVRVTFTRIDTNPATVVLNASTHGTFLEAASFPK